MPPTTQANWYLLFNVNLKGNKLKWTHLAVGLNTDPCKIVT